MMRLNRSFGSTPRTASRVYIERALPLLSSTVALSVISYSALPTETHPCSIRTRPPAPPPTPRPPEPCLPGVVEAERTRPDRQVVVVVGECESSDQGADTLPLGLCRLGPTPPESDMPEVWSSLGEDLRSGRTEVAHIRIGIPGYSDPLPRYSFDQCEEFWERIPTEVVFEE